MEAQNNSHWFDKFTRNMLIGMFVLLSLIFGSSYYMNQNNMQGQGTDGLVNDMAALATQQKHHPFIELPGDAEVGAFSVANLFAGLIVGYNWRKLFEGNDRKE